MGQIKGRVMLYLFENECSGYSLTNTKNGYNLHHFGDWTDTENIQGKLRDTGNGVRLNIRGNKLDLDYSDLEVLSTLLEYAKFCEKGIEQSFIKVKNV